MPTPRRRLICLLFLDSAKQMSCIFLQLLTNCFVGITEWQLPSAALGHVSILLPHSLELLDLAMHCLTTG